MSFLDKVLKRKKEPTAKKEENKLFVKPVLADSKESVSDGVVEKKFGKVIFGVIKRPHITEKSANFGKQNKYMFIVSSVTNKLLVKQAVEARYGVLVKKVAVLSMPPKKRMRGQQIGWRKGFKKAMVTLKEGQTIEIQ